MKNYDRRLRALTLSNFASWLIIAVLVLSGFRSRDAHLRVEQLDAERVNIIGSNGAPVLAIANPRLIPGVMIGGKEYPRDWDGRDQMSGMIFFNERGDEVGGLIYHGIAKDSGYSAGGHFSFDQYKQNQVVALQYLDNGRSRRAGMRVWDRPTDHTIGEFFELGLARSEAHDPAVRDSLRAEQQALRDAGALGVERMFIGSQDEVAQLQIRDSQGRVRVRLLVDEDDRPRLEFLDEGGEVTATYPHSGRAL